MKPTIPFMVENFKRFNEQFFNNELPIPIFALVKRGNAFGDCRTCKTRVYYRIRLNFMYDRELQAIETTLIHEMIHLYIHYHNLYDNSSHGCTFQRIAARIKNESNGYYDIKKCSPIKLENEYDKTNTPRYVIYMPQRGFFTVCAQINIRHWFKYLREKYMDIELYKTYYTLFKNFKVGRSIVTYYAADDTIKTLLEKSENITDEYLN